MTFRLPGRHQPPAYDPDACGHSDFHGFCGACQRRYIAERRAADQRGREAAAIWQIEHGQAIAERNARYRREHRWDA